MTGVRWNRITTRTALLLLLAAAPVPDPVPLSPRPGTALDKTARRLVARDLAEALRQGDSPLVLVGSAILDPKSGKPALFIQLQSARECGSAGCSTSVWLERGKSWERVLDGVAGKLSISSRRTRGMADILAGTTRYVWNGRSYNDPRPSPKLDLGLKKPEARPRQ